ncbi:reverse transcriptase N-terminal domain-containing protein [Streptomyces sp. NPDC047706]|uniref:reverse transcriptase N-terminal domain-containing protein n=1 Tax=Streptomyces sp. NPDC047706 TaxID=3365486 RepID=UPI0037157A32
MLRSLSHTLVSVRRATEINAGRKTAGVDGQVVLTAPGEAELARFIQQRSSRWRARPVRRVFIPKNGAGRKRRPLGIPVIIDRCHQARAANALEPEWEARFEARSYGFRPGRGCHAAIGVIYNKLNGRNPGACGSWTLTWRRRSTASTTTTFSPVSAPFPPGTWCGSG